MKSYTCQACQFSINARAQPKDCPYCGFSEPAINTKFRGNREIDPQRGNPGMGPNVNYDPARAIGA